jgi:hypothetical protein
VVKVGKYDNKTMVFFAKQVFDGNFNL